MRYYENDSYYPAPPPMAPKKKKGIKTFLSILLAVALLGAAVFGGVLLGKTALDRKAEVQPTRAPLVTAAPAQNTNTPQEEGLLQLTPGGGTAAFRESGPFTKAQVCELAAPSVVGIDVSAQYAGNYYGLPGGQTGSGSGVIVTEDGYIVTCLHVINGADAISVTLNDDRSFEATVVGYDTRNDIAIIKIEATGLTPAALGDSDTVTVGEEVLAIGNPLGELRGTATAGIISATKRYVEVEGMPMTLLQTDAAISPGNSGGGLFNARAELIGIVNAKTMNNSAEGLGFAIPLSSVLTEMNDLLLFGYVKGRAYLGVYTQDVTLRRGGSDAWGQYFGVPCVQIADIVPDSAAERAGLKIGDLILAVNDTEITSGAQLSATVAQFNAGDSVTLTIQRGAGQEMEELKIEIVFGERVPEPNP
ncbi:MAG: trypsin-like peptidase domain-containing protein [Clostridiales bacterium]|nr:trypsin-like peptidase domain-containing protein [Clostridiales bacterium]